MYYITFIDPPGGVFQSQVVDVVKKLNSLGNANVQGSSVKVVTMGF